VAREEEKDSTRCSTATGKASNPNGTGSPTAEGADKWRRRLEFAPALPLPTEAGRDAADWEGAGAGTGGGADGSMEERQGGGGHARGWRLEEERRRNGLLSAD
jgi:hypothetical protein